MQTLSSQVVDMLKAEDEAGFAVSIYMKQVIIQLNKSYSTSQLEALKEKIEQLIKDHFPQREESVSLILRGNQMEDEAFVVDKPSG